MLSAPSTVLNIAMTWCHGMQLPGASCSAGAAAAGTAAIMVAGIMVAGNMVAAATAAEVVRRLLPSLPDAA